MLASRSKQPRADLWEMCTFHSLVSGKMTVFDKTEFAKTREGNVHDSATELFPSLSEIIETDVFGLDHVTNVTIFLNETAASG